MKWVGMVNWKFDGLKQLGEKTHHHLRRGLTLIYNRCGLFGHRVLSTEFGLEQRWQNREIFLVGRKSDWSSWSEYTFFEWPLSFRHPENQSAKLDVVVADRESVGSVRLHHRMSTHSQRIHNRAKRTMTALRGPFCEIDDWQNGGEPLEW